MVNIDPKGTVLFSVSAPRARRVELVGAFDGWAEQRLPMRPDGDGTWSVVLDLEPGEYLFRYCLDGWRWRVDGRAHGRRIAADGTVKSRLWQPPRSLEPDAIV